MGGLCFQVLEKIMQLATGDVPIVHNILDFFYLFVGAKFPPFIVIICIYIYIYLTPLNISFKLPPKKSLISLIQDCLNFDLSQSQFLVAKA